MEPISVWRSALRSTTTLECAYATFDEKQKGTLAPGMLADVAVLATDVFSHEPATAADLAVKFTIFDGRMVYRAAGQSIQASGSRLFRKQNKGSPTSIYGCP